MKKLMLVGRTGAGKTSLTQRLTGEAYGYKKTQVVDYCDYIIDTPGEYIENKVYYKALIVSAMEADVVGLVQPANEPESCFPPGFASAFSRPVIGIITKTDLTEDLGQAQHYLQDAGVACIFQVSSETQAGIEDIKQLLLE